MRRRVLVCALATVLVPSAALAQTAGGDPYGGASQPTTTSTGDTAGAAVDLTAPGGDTDGDTGSGGGPAPVQPTVERRTVQLYGPCAPKPDLPAPAYLQDQVRVLPNGAWQVVRTYCEGDPLPPPAPPQPDPQVAQDVAVHLRAQVRAPRPAVVVQPSGGALVGQPGVFWLRDPGAPPTASDADPLVPGLTVVVSLGAPSYTWTWGDGGSGSSGTSRGRAYAAGDRVPGEGRGAPLVSHTFAAPGTRTVTVTADYPVVFRWNGQTRALPPVRATAQVQVPVRAARSELVRR